MHSNEHQQELVVLKLNEFSRVYKKVQKVQEIGEMKCDHNRERKL